MPEKQTIVVEVVDGKVIGITTALPDGVAPEVVVVDHTDRTIQREAGNRIDYSSLANQISSWKAGECDCGYDCGAHGYTEVER